MTFDTDEQSIVDSRPIDLYEITTPVTVYRVTTYHRDFVFGGNTYAAIPTSRGQLTVTGGSEPRELTLYLPISHALPQRYLASGIPPKSVQVLHRRYQQSSGIAVQQWAGEATTIGVDDTGTLATFLVPTALGQRGKVRLPVLIASRNCNNALGDSVCQVDLSLFKVPTTIVSASGVTVVVASVALHPDHWARFGSVYHAASNERRYVVDQVGTTLTLNVPLIGATATQAIDLFKGCDHTVEMCLADFNNVDNLIGCPQINGTINPWGAKSAGTSEGG